MKVIRTQLDQLEMHLVPHSIETEIKNYEIFCCSSSLLYPFTNDIKLETKINDVFVLYFDVFICVSYTLNDGACINSSEQREEEKKRTKMR